MILNSIKIVTFFLCFDMLIFATHQKTKNPCKILIYRDFLCFTILSSGETGIRTPDTLLGYTRFPGVPLQPLEHLSFSGRKSKGSFRNHQIFGINNLSNAYKIKPNPSSFPKKKTIYKFYHFHIAYKNETFFISP